MKRAVFFVSDSTGITAEAIGRGVLAQFEEVEFSERTLPFVDDAAKAAAAADDIRAAAKEYGARAIVFCTFVSDALATIVRESGALTMDCLDAFTPHLESELKIQSAHRLGRLHSSHGRDYQRRIDALNFTMNHDDGASKARADIILIGVSRSGKTPTSLYLALHYGIFTANYPLVDEDLSSPQLPEPLRPFAAKLHALTINPRRLSAIQTPRIRFASCNILDANSSTERRVTSKHTISLPLKINSAARTSFSQFSMSAYLLSGRRC